MIQKLTTAIFFVGIFILPHLSFTQDSDCEIQEWEWAQQITTKATNPSSQISSLVHDSLNNFYIGGYYNGQITLGDTTLYFGDSTILAYHRSDFLAKFDSHGNLVWAQNAGESGEIQLKLSDDELIILQTSDSVYLSKFSLMGDMKWKKATGVLPDGRTTSLDIDQIGNIYIGGYFNDTAYFNDAVLTSPEETSGFILKFDEEAILEWSIKVASNGFSEIDDLALNSVGEVYAVGFFYGIIKYGADSISTDGSYNAMMLKYNSDGEIIFIDNVAKAPIESYGESLTIDGDDNVLIGGSYASTNTSSEDTATTIIGTDHYTLNGSFIAKYDVNGFFIWSEKVEDGGQKYIDDLETDSSNDVYVGAGTFTHTLYKYRSNGVSLWKKPVNSFMYNASRFLLDLNNNDELVITGRFENEITFGGTSLSSVNGFDYYLAKLTVSNSLPSPQLTSSKIKVTELTAASISLTWENGDGTGRLVLLKKLGRVNPSNIVDGIIYNDGAGEFGSGTQTAEREFVVYSGSGSEITVTGLQKGRPYQVAIIEYNDSSACPNQINYLQENVAKKFFVAGGVTSLFSVYPNPFSNEELTIQLPDNTSEEDFLILSDAFGRDIIKRKVKRLSTQNGEVKVNTASLNLPSGIYYLRLTGQSAIRIVKE